MIAPVSPAWPGRGAIGVCDLADEMSDEISEEIPMGTPSTRAPAEDVWTGRHDGDGPEFARWHQVVRVLDQESRAGAPIDPASGAAINPATDAAINPSTGPSTGPATGAPRIALVGFASDEGVRRNQGRPGAAQGPTALRRALAPLALHRDLSIVDAGDVVVEGGDLESAQAVLGQVVAGLLDAGHLVVVLGGGHESAYGSALGRASSVRLAPRRVGVLNLDAHFDLRDAPQATSGTPFAQMAGDDEAAGRDFIYAALGINRDANTAALFAAADALGGRYLLDSECQPSRSEETSAFVAGFLDGVEAVHLSVDLDVLPAAAAPGVSAPAAFGVPLEVLLAVGELVAASGTLAVVDIVELCPPLDQDGRTARAAARLISSLVHALPRTYPIDADR